MSITYLRLEVLRMFRNPRFAIFSIAFPALLFLLQASLFATGEDADVIVKILMVNLMAFGVFFAAMSNGARLAVERAAGWQRQLRLTPLSGRAYLAGKGLSGLLLALPALLLVPAVALVAKGVELDAGSWTRILVGIWLGSIPFLLLGLLVGQLSRPETLQPVNMSISLVMGFLGGLWIPIDGMPDWLREIAPVLPSYWLTQLGRGAVTSDLTESLPVTLAVLAAWTVGLGALVIWRYRKDSARA